MIISVSFIKNIHLREKMANKYIKDIEDFTINYKVLTSTTLSVYDTPETIYDEDILESDVVSDVNLAGGLIIDNILSGCIIPKEISDEESKGYRLHYENFICVYNATTKLKSVFSVEYDIQNFSSNVNFGLISDVKVNGEYTHPNTKLFLKLLKTTYGKVGTYDYINNAGRVSRVHKPLLIQVGVGKVVDDPKDFTICRR
jgi:hypothetical protein